MKSKHLIVPTQYYDPETFQVNHLVSLFLAKGWKVTVIAPLPSYPSFSAFRGHTSTIFHHPSLKICRFPTVRRNGTLLSTIFNSILFSVIGSFLTLFYALRFPRSCIFAVQYSPFTCILPAWFAAFFLKKNASLWIFDLWPQSFSVLIDRYRIPLSLYNVLDSIVSFIYSSFSNFYVSSPSFMNVPPVHRLKGVELLYSWENNSVQPRFGLESADLSLPVKIISIGNLGAVHDLDFLEEFLLYSASHNIIWEFVGGGTGMQRLRTFCESHQLKHISFHGFLPKQECLNLCTQADFSIVPFRDSSISDTICYRFVSSLSVATPVISFGNNAVSEIIRSSACGLTISPCDDLKLHDHLSDFSFETISDLVASIFSNVSLFRTSFRRSAFALFQSHFSQRAAEESLKQFF